MEKQFQAFLDGLIPSIQKLITQVNQGYWDMTTKGGQEAEDRYSKLKEELIKIFADKESFKQLKEFKASSEINDSLLARQLTVLYNQFVTNQIDDESIKELIRLETEIESTFGKFRAEYKGKRISDNDINTVLSEELDNANRKEVWEASKQIGAQVAPTLLELVKLRNKTAVELGFKDFYAMQLEAQEMNEEELFGILDKLKELTDAPFARIKGKLDKSLAKKFGINVEDMRPWHYSDRFFQEVPKTGEIDEDKFFKGKDIVEIAKKYYDSIGLDTQDILDRSDLFEREGKNQHAYCMHVDKCGDVRTLCNIVPNEQWMGTTLHELGHGVYDKYIDMELPYLLREPAHTFTTEAIAMLFGRLTKNTEWLETMAGVDKAEIEAVSAQLEENLAISMLVFVRWALVMVYFERALYRNTDCDLNTLWWDKVEELQLVKRPEDRNAPDWASKIHLGTAPVYYHNYILGELTASQIQTAISGHTGSRSMVNNSGIGQFLTNNIFRPASRFYWNEMLALATGEPLNPEHFVKQFVK